MVANESSDPRLLAIDLITESCRPDRPVKLGNIKDGCTQLLMLPRSESQGEYVRKLLGIIERVPLADYYTVRELPIWNEIWPSVESVKDAYITETGELIPERQVRR